MSPDEFKRIRMSLGLTADNFATMVRVNDGKTVRTWENGHVRKIPGPIEVICEALRDSQEVREYFGLSDPRPLHPRYWNKTRRRTPETGISVGVAVKSGWKVFAHCDDCLVRAEIDLPTMVMLRGGKYMLNSLARRLTCVACGSQKMRVSVDQSNATRRRLPLQSYWQENFINPVQLPDGREVATLTEALDYVGTVERDDTTWRLAVIAIKRAVGGKGSTTEAANALREALAVKP